LNGTHPAGSYTAVLTVDGRGSTLVSTTPVRIEYIDHVIAFYSDNNAVVAASLLEMESIPQKLNLSLGVLFSSATLVPLWTGIGSQPSDIVIQSDLVLFTQGSNLILTREANITSVEVQLLEVTISLNSALRLNVSGTLDIDAAIKPPSAVDGYDSTIPALLVYAGGLVTVHATANIVAQQVVIYSDTHVSVQGSLSVSRPPTCAEPHFNLTCGNVSPYWGHPSDSRGWFTLESSLNTVTLAARGTLTIESGSHFFGHKMLLCARFVCVCIHVV
jgi:hypothetical protein